MQNIDSNNGLSSVELADGRDENDSSEPVVVFRLHVPVAAKVPAPRPQAEMAKLVVLQESVTSTVPANILVQLLSNSTAVATTWRATATLTSGPAAHRVPLY